MSFTMSVSPPPASLFLGLGRPTRRGIRKCPRCGTVNGTRGFSCKNPNCQHVFPRANKAKGAKKRDAAADHDCRRMVAECGTHRRLYSVATKTARGEDRAFVLICDSGAEEADQQENDGPEDALPDPRWPAVNTCLADDCRGRSPAAACSHVSSCLRASSSCENERTADPLRVKSSVLNQMSIGAEIKHKIWLCAQKSGGPLVQRVSPTVMAVKCRPHPSSAPFGYVHVHFESGATRMWCSCEGDLSSTSSGAHACIHFFACVAVFASDDKLSEEFGFFIALQQELSDSPINQVTLNFQVLSSTDN